MRRSRGSPSLFLAAAAGAVEFPRDHGAHADAAVEWWYYTGHLADAAGKPYGFQLTFFRARDAAPRALRVDRRRRQAVPRTKRRRTWAAGYRAARAGRLDVVQRGLVGAKSRTACIASRRAGPDGALELDARRRQGRPSLHGAGGISQEGRRARTSTRTTSRSRASRLGDARAAAAGARRSTGTAWFDHEWGPGALPAGAAGWDWFGAPALRRLGADALPDARLPTAAPRPSRPAPSSRPTGAPRARSPGTTSTLVETARWTSPRSKAAYPAVWSLAVALARARRRRSRRCRRPGARHREVHRRDLLGGRLPRRGHARRAPDRRPRLRRDDRLRRARRARASRAAGLDRPARSCVLGRLRLHLHRDDERLRLVHVAVDERKPDRAVSRSPAGGTRRASRPSRPRRCCRRRRRSPRRRRRSCRDRAVVVDAHVGTRRRTGAIPTAERTCRA